MENKPRFEAIAKDFYSEEDFNFAREMYDFAVQFKLGVEMSAVAFLIKADTDNPSVLSEIESKLGKSVVSSLLLLNRISRVTMPETQRRIMDLRKIFIEITDDLRLIIIKLIERLITLKSVVHKNTGETKLIAEECLYLYSPIAHRLGISKIYQPMEDYSFKAIHPADYKKIHKAIEIRRAALERKLKTMIYHIAEHLKESRVPGVIKYRVKRPYSVYRKLKNQNTTIENIHDLMALRIITTTPEQCYLILGKIHSKYIPIEKRFRDWITYPKPNGYRSIQTTVHNNEGDKFEIQIRTVEMDIEAEYGSSAHWAYKEGNKGKDELWTKKLKEFLDNDEYFENPVELFENLKNEMKSDYIHVLTPKGEIVSLVEKATPIDFAFAVHTDLGYKVTGARVNGKFARLKTELKSGDVVEVITSNSAKPSRDWLEFVQSARSRSKILRWFKNNERDLMIDSGKKNWERIKKDNKSKINGFDEDTVFRSSTVKMGFDAPEDFFWSIANGNTKCTLTLLKKIYPKAFEKSILAKEAAKSKINLKKLGPQITVEGLGGIETRIAKCCHPIKGQEIIAYVTRRSEIKIHRKDCPYVAADGIDIDNLKLAEWGSGASLQRVQLKIFGTNYAKMLADFANEAADNSLIVASTGMQNMGKKGVSLVVDIEVEDVDQLHKFTNRLRLLASIDNIKIVD